MRPGHDIFKGRALILFLCRPICLLRRTIIFFLLAFGHAYRGGGGGQGTIENAHPMRCKHVLNHPRKVQRGNGSLEKSTFVVGVVDVATYVISVNNMGIINSIHPGLR
jgi:hypothetical protein